MLLQSWELGMTNLERLAKIITKDMRIDEWLYGVYRLS